MKNDRPRNYTVKALEFRVVREPGAPDPRAVDGPAAVITIVKALDIIPDDAREHFVVLMLNAQNKCIAWHAVSTGTLSATLVHPRDVFGPALRTMGVASLILVHNHPSGDPKPSAEDIRLTRQLAEGARLLDLRIHDHVIIGNGTDKFTSMATEGLL